MTRKKKKERRLGAVKTVDVRITWRVDLDEEDTRWLENVSTDSDLEQFYAARIFGTEYVPSQDHAEHISTEYRKGMIAVSINTEAQK